MQTLSVYMRGNGDTAVAAVASATAVVVDAAISFLLQSKFSILFIVRCSL